MQNNNGVNSFLYDWGKDIKLSFGTKLIDIKRIEDLTEVYFFRVDCSSNTLRSIIGKGMTKSAAESDAWRIMKDRKLSIV
jgi:hypothetical protein